MSTEMPNLVMKDECVIRTYNVEAGLPTLDEARRLCGTTLLPQPHSSSRLGHCRNSGLDCFGLAHNSGRQPCDTTSPLPHHLSLRLGHWRNSTPDCIAQPRLPSLPWPGLLWLKTRLSLCSRCLAGATKVSTPAESPSCRQLRPV